MVSTSLSDGGELRRHLGLFDAVVIGLGSMIGAGIFASLAPAAGAAGSGLLLGLAIAAVVAYCNATSSARLAARYPQSGGTYVYGRERLGDFWGYLAGWGFVVGKTASCAAMALTVGYYAWPSQAHLVAVVAVLALTAVNYVGIQKSVWLTRAIVAVVLAVLAAVVVACLVSPGAQLTGLAVGTDATPRRRAPGGRAALLRLRRVCADRHVGRGGARTPGAPSPARSRWRSGSPWSCTRRWPWPHSRCSARTGSAVRLHRLSRPYALPGVPGLAPVVRVGAAVAALGSLLALILGVSRTTLAMARDRHLPHVLAAVHPRFMVPHRAELAVGAVVAVLAAVTDVRGAIGFSSFGVLTYYAIANASAWTLTPAEGRPWRLVPTVGAAGCVVLAFSLPLTSVLWGAAVIAIGAAVYGLRAAGGRRPA